MLGYKVVRKVSSKTFKPVTSSAILSTRYVIGQTTVQDRKVQGPFAVFKNLDRARDYLVSWDDCVIVRCEYEPSREIKLWRLLTPYVKAHARLGDRDLLKGIFYRGILDCPDGTVFAKSVTPLEVVYDPNKD